MLRIAGAIWKEAWQIVWVQERKTHFQSKGAGPACSELSVQPPQTRLACLCSGMGSSNLLVLAVLAQV